MTTATKSKKAKQKDGRAEVGSGEARSAAVITADIEAARAKRDKIGSWDTDSLDPIDAAIATLTDELELARFAELPPPDPFTMLIAEKHIALADIIVTGNHREEEDNGADIARLARSLELVGLQQRIGVRDMGDGKYELIFGSRRRRAAIYVNWSEIPAKVYPPETTPAQVELLRDIENFNRKDLSPVERAIAVARTIDTVEKMAVPKTEEGRKLIAAVEACGGRDAYVGQLLGYPAAWVRDHAYVSKIGSKARELLAAKRINIDHARELAKLGDIERADDFAERAARKADGTGGSTAAEVRKWVLEELRSLKSVPWRLDVAVKGKGSLTVACDKCQFNTKADPLLFEHDANGEADAAGLTTAAGVCRNGGCFTARQQIAKDAIEAGLADAAKAVKKAKGEILLTEKGLADFIPVTIRGGTFARKAKATINPDTGAAAKKTSSGNRGEQQEKLTPEQIAYKRYREALDKWTEAAAGKIAAKVNADPLRKLYLITLCESGVIRDLECSSPYFYGDAKARDQQKKESDARNAKARKLVTAGAHKSVVKRMAKPTLADLTAMAKRLGKVEAHEFNDLIDSALIAFGDAVGVKISEPPSLDALVKEELAKAPAAAADADAAKLTAAQRKAAEESAREASEIEDDEAFDDEE